MKNNSLSKRENKVLTEGNASSIKATAQQQALPSDGELDAFNYNTTSNITTIVRTTIDYLIIYGI